MRMSHYGGRLLKDIKGETANTTDTKNVCRAISLQSSLTAALYDMGNGWIYRITISHISRSSQELSYTIRNITPKLAQPEPSHQTHMGQEHSRHRTN